MKGHASKAPHNHLPDHQMEMRGQLHAVVTMYSGKERLGVRLDSHLRQRTVSALLGIESQLSRFYLITLLAELSYRKN
jgi:hypothetical protein